MELGEYRKNFFAAYETNGYVLLKGMLKSDMAIRLRNYIEGQFSEESEKKRYDIINDAAIGSIKLDVFNRFHEIYRQVFFETSLIFHLKLLLGNDLVIIPETGIHKNSFGPWHKDVRMHQNAGLTFHWEEDFHIVTVALYFQPNTAEYGGGLEVIPQSHKIRFPQYPPDINGEHVASEPGDVVIFNHNLDHKASWPSREVPHKNTKYSLFICASKNNSHAEKYMAYLKTRPVYGWMHGYTYPDDLCRHAMREGYALAR